MPYIMSLEGPQLATVDELRAELYANIPKGVWRLGAELRGITDPIKAHPLAIVGGLILGAWLAGSIKGQALVRRYAPSKRK